LLAQALTGLGQIERDLHNGDATLRCYKAADLYRTLDEPLRLAHTVRHVGDILQDGGQFHLAAACYEKAGDLSRSRGNASP
jgi:tetratricopeptide (TPR) repeat protein